MCRSIKVLAEGLEPVLTHPVRQRPGFALCVCRLFRSLSDPVWCHSHGRPNKTCFSLSSHLIYHWGRWATWPLLFSSSRHMFPWLQVVFARFRSASNQHRVDKRSRTAHHPMHRSHLEQNFTRVRDVPRLTIDSVFIGHATMV